MLGERRFGYVVRELGCVYGNGPVARRQSGTPGPNPRPYPSYRALQSCHDRTRTDGPSVIILMLHRCQHNWQLQAHPGLSPAAHHPQRCGLGSAQLWSQIRRVAN